MQFNTSGLVMKSPTDYQHMAILLFFMFIPALLIGYFYYKDRRRKRAAELQLGTPASPRLHFRYGLMPLNNTTDMYQSMVRHRARRIIQTSQLTRIELMKRLSEDVLNSKNNEHKCFINDVMTTVEKSLYPEKKL
jgi:hypothetical protein